MLFNGSGEATQIDTDVTALLWNPRMMWGFHYYYFHPSYFGY